MWEDYSLCAVNLRLDESPGVVDSETGRNLSVASCLLEESVFCGDSKRNLAVVAAPGRTPYSRPVGLNFLGVEIDNLASIFRVSFLQNPLKSTSWYFLGCVCM